METKQITAGSRIGAMFLDHIVMSFLMVLMLFPIMSFGFGDSLNDESLRSPFYSGWELYLMIFAVSLYFNKDIIQGKSIAKRALKQEVIDVKTNEIASPFKCLIRNLSIIIWPIEVIVVLVSPSRRIGDFIAGTRVEYISQNRDSKPPINYKNVLLSIIIGFSILASLNVLFLDKIGDGSFESPDFISSSYNKELSDLFENTINDKHPDDILDTHFKVFDKVENDSIKYIAGTFYLTEDYENSDFDLIKDEIFNTMFTIIPKYEFILYGKFVYQDEWGTSTTAKNYDWRKIDK